MATIANIMVQVEGYTCYTLINILCIITHNIITNYSHNTAYTSLLEDVSLDKKFIFEELIICGNQIFVYMSHLVEEND